MKNNNFYILVIILLLKYTTSHCQIASDTLGCIPLLVQFNSPDQGITNPIWDFKDGTSSDLLNPSHIYSTAGTYQVTLKNKDTLVASVKIIIYPELIPTMEIDTNQGCAPITISFGDLTNLPSGVSVIEYLWDFGDGSGALGKNLNYTYLDIGEYDVTLNLKTNIEECNISKTFKDAINIREKQDVSFTLDSIAPKCIFPTFLYLNYSGISDPTYTYKWDFGNGTNGTKAQPEPVKYVKEGRYLLSLEVNNNKGCKSKISENIDIFLFPEINISMADSICLNSTLNIINNTKGKEFLWNFGENAVPQTSSARKPQGVTYHKAGLQDIRLTVISDLGCMKDTSFQINISNPDASFTIDPPMACSLPVEFKFKANDTSHKSYEWNSVSDGIEHKINKSYIKRDTFYDNKIDSATMSLNIISKDGCSATSSKRFFVQLPNAQFELNTFEGEEPFLLKVTDKSESIYPIVTWIFTWGDGTSSEYDSSTIGNASHLYEVPGKYYVNLAIINEKGCADYHYGAWITVHQRPIFKDQQPPICNGGGGGGNPTLCYKDFITFILNNVPAQFDAFHFDMGNTIAHCEKLKVVKALANDDPGKYDLSATLENGGKFYEYKATEQVEIHGAKAKIRYSISCNNKNSVYFENKSINATNTYWVIEGKKIEKDTFHYLFAGKGDYKVILIAENPIHGCKPDTTEVNIQLKEIKAEINTENHWCSGVPTLLTSSQSKDEVVGCKFGYLWSFPKYLDKGNIITDNDSIMVALPAGLHKISLEVRDVNGCKDTAYFEIMADTIKANFISDRPAICDSLNVVFQDISAHDNPINKYEWNLLPNENKPSISYLFDSLNSDFVLVRLKITDIYGCASQITKKFQVYQPETTVTFDSIMCESNLKSISASDFTRFGSNLAYFWLLDGHLIQSNNLLNLPPLDPGLHNLKLKIIEKATGCDNYYAFNFNVIKDPFAIISGIEDSVYCYPKTFQMFGNQTIKDSIDEVTYKWNFDNNRKSNKDNPVVTFGKGDFRISLTAESKYGCKHTSYKSISLVGPEGILISDKKSVCKGEIVTFKVINPKDVTSFYWDFGQGETNNNISEVPYKYNYLPESGKTFTTVVLRSANTGCETILTIPINIYKVEANFLPDSTCQDSIKVLNLSKGAEKNFWSYNGKIFSTELEPFINPGSTGTFPFKLIITNDTFGCSDSIVNAITFLKRPDIFSLPIINLCGNEIYSVKMDPSNKYEFNPTGLAQIKDGNILISASKSTNLEIKATAINGCNTIKNVLINHSDYSNKDSLNSFIVCGDLNAIQLSPGLQSGDSINWTLNGGDLLAGTLSCENCNDPRIISPIEGELRATIFNQDLCKQRTLFYLIENADIEVPNIFSPNGDNINDVFRPVLKTNLQDSLVLQSLQIFNRWGKQVYHSDKPWDGNINGIPAATEVYYFTMQYTIGRFCNNNKKGDLTLIR